SSSEVAMHHTRRLPADRAGPCADTSPPSARQARARQADTASWPGRDGPTVRFIPARRPEALGVGDGKDATNRMAPSGAAVAAQGARMVARPQSAAPPM